jgi:hypothetical protein
MTRSVYCDRGSGDLSSLDNPAVLGDIRLARAATLTTEGRR